VTAIYAIVESGGKQYRVTEGQTLDLELLYVPEGETVELERVLLVERDAQVTLGRPYLPDAKVVAEVLGQVKGRKLIVFKYKPKTRYRRKTGHRQRYTRVLIKSIQTAP
jgi:large subunit ribosomal protein L21